MIRRLSEGDELGKDVRETKQRFVGTRIPALNPKWVGLVSPTMEKYHWGHAASLMVLWRTVLERATNDTPCEFVKPMMLGYNAMQGASMEYNAQIMQKQKDPTVSEIVASMSCLSDTRIDAPLSVCCSDTAATV